MAKLTSFEEALRIGMIKEGDSVNFGEFLFESKSILDPYPKKEVILTQDETGWNEPQKFLAETLEWFYAKDANGVPTLWGEITKSKLYLQGEEGYLLGVYALNKICSLLYSKLSLGFVARAMNETDINHLKQNEELQHILENAEPFWLATSVVKEDKYLGNVFLGMRSKEGINVNDVCLLRSDRCRFYKDYGFRPVVSIYNPSNVSVEMVKR